MQAAESAETYVHVYQNTTLKALYFVIWISRKVKQIN